MTSKFTKSLLGTALLTGLLVAGASGAQTLGEEAAMHSSALQTQE